MELELNSLDWNVNELEHELELEDMKHTMDCSAHVQPKTKQSWSLIVKLMIDNIFLDRSGLRLETRLLTWGWGNDNELHKALKMRF